MNKSPDRIPAAFLSDLSLSFVEFKDDLADPELAMTLS